MSHKVATGRVGTRHFVDSEPFRGYFGMIGRSDRVVSWTRPVGCGRADLNRVPPGIQWPTRRRSSVVELGIHKPSVAGSNPAVGISPFQQRVAAALNKPCFRGLEALFGPRGQLAQADVAEAHLGPALIRADAVDL